MWPPGATTSGRPCVRESTHSPTDASWIAIAAGSSTPSRRVGSSTTRGDADLQRRHDHEADQQDGLAVVPHRRVGMEQPGGREQDRDDAAQRSPESRTPPPSRFTPSVRPCSVLALLPALSVARAVTMTASLPLAGQRPRPARVRRSRTLPRPGAASCAPSRSRP